MHAFHTASTDENTQLQLGSASGLIDYEIDALNRRVGKKINGVKQWGLLCQTDLAPVAQLDANNQVVSVFVYATHKHVPDYMVKGGQTYRFVVDHLGSVRLVVNVADGSVAQRTEYDEFGVVTTDTAPGFQPFGFAGGIYDADTGLVRFGARDYDAVVGRWTAKDPILFEGGQENLYVYVGGDPVNEIDPTGTLSKDEIERFCKDNGRPAECRAALKASCGNSNKGAQEQCCQIQFNYCTQSIGERCGRGLHADCKPADTDEQGQACAKQLEECRKPTIPSGGCGTRGPGMH